MAYSKQSWTDGSSGGTPLSAARLQHMEDGIAAAVTVDGGGAAVGQVPTVTQASPLQFGLMDPPWGALVAPPTGAEATDEANIVAAVTEAGPGGLVQFAPGTYVADTLAPLTGQVWQGSDTTLARPATSAASVVSATGVDDVTIRGITFDGARATSPATSNPLVLLIDADRPRVIDCTFRNTPATNAGVIFRGTVGGLISGCRFKDVGYAALIGLNLGDAYTCRDNMIAGCTVDTTDWNAFFFTENLGSTSFSTTIAAASDGQTLPQATINVAATSGLPTTGRVRIGGYGGPVVAYTGKTSTTLTGCTVISGSGTLSTGQAVQIAVQGLVQGTVMTGCTLRAYGDCGVESGSGTVGTVIAGNSFFGSALSNQSILFRDARDCSATGNTCANNTKTNAGAGIYLFNLNGTTERIALTGNRVFGNAYCGIIADTVRDVTISGGQVTDTTRVGIRLRNVVGAEITGVAVLRSGEGGIELGQAGTNAVTDGVVTGCRIMDNNQSAAGSGSGLLLFGATTALISGNRIGDRQTVTTQVYGIRVFDGEVTADIVNNDLSGNATAGLQNFDNSTTIRVMRNRGYNGQGVQNVVPGASPWTYTAGITPEVMYSSGGTVSGYTKNGLAVPGPAFTLEPGEQVVVTYSVAPTVRIDRK